MSYWKLALGIAMFAALVGALTYCAVSDLEAACTPLPTCTVPLVSPCATPTPTLRGDQPDHANAVGVRAYWRYPGDTFWRGSRDFPAFLGDSESGPTWPVIERDVPAQRIVPTAEQLVDIEIVFKSYSAANVESAPSEIISICMPRIWAGGPYQ